MSAASEPRSARDPRLDIFRGLGMLIILIAHIPNNPPADWIPARFGFSDATEIFVFCSGIASALAFGRVFDRAGLALGTARIAHRIWQVYWAHVGVFVATVAALALADRMIPGAAYLRHDLNLGPLLDDPAARLAEFFALAYVPNYFDILPMYLVILALVPILMTATRIGGAGLALGTSAGLWLVALAGILDLPAELWGTKRAWFFNPFAWQFLFVLGFGFAQGWLKVPRADRRLVLIATAVLAAAAPVSCQYGWSCYAAWGTMPALGEAHQAIGSLIDKTHLGPLRIVHFLALAYLAVVAAGAGGRRLAGLPGLQAVTLLGRQTLAVFLAGLWLAQVLGVLLDLVGRDTVSLTVANAGGCALLVATALLCEWFKTTPWNAPRRARVRHAGPEGASAGLVAIARH